MSQLEPCPFTGKKAKLMKHVSLRGRVKYHVSSGNIYTKGFSQGKSAVKLWNTRTTKDTAHCDACAGTGRIECEPDSPHTHPCDTCRSAENDIFQKGVEYGKTLQEKSYNPDTLKALEFVLEEGTQTEWRLFVENHAEAIRTALERPQVDVEGLKKQEVGENIAQHRINRGWNDCINYLHEQGYLSTPDTYKEAKENQ